MAAINRIILIAGGGAAGRALEIVRESREGDLLIGADRGALFLVQHGFKPAVAFGDFDSVTAEERAFIEANAWRVESFDAVDKDWTDTELAFRWAVEQRPRQIVLLGVTGTRMDHTLTNLFLLETALESGIDCVAIDETNEIRLIDRPTTVARGPYDYFSLVSVSPVTTGITLEGFQYPLRYATLRRGQSLGVSNVFTGETGTVSLDSGLLLVIQSRD